jgi:hypothetical protein
MEVKNRGIADVTALNPNPLVDPTNGDETRLID